MSNPAGNANTRIGSYLEKTWDRKAFPSNFGFSELDRAQMRYIFAGGSPKADDKNTLPPGAFTCSLIFQEPGHKASTHHHRIEELFFVHSGHLTMSWQFDDTLVDFIVGPGDAVLNPSSRPHGFRNDGPDDCVMQIMVATAETMLSTYTDHPADFPESPLHQASAEQTANLMPAIEPFLARPSSTKVLTTNVDGGVFTAAPYVVSKGHGGLIEPSHLTYCVSTLTRGAATPVYSLDVEEAFMVLSGVLDIETEDADGSMMLQRCGPPDQQ